MSDGISDFIAQTTVFVPALVLTLSQETNSGRFTSEEPSSSIVPASYLDCLTAFNLCFPLLLPQLFQPNQSCFTELPFSFKFPTQSKKETGFCFILPGLLGGLGVEW